MWYIEMGGNHINNNKHIFQRNIFTSINNKSEIRKKFNNIDVYSTIFQYDNEDQNNSRLYGPMYLDLDMNICSDSQYEILKQEVQRITAYLNIHYDIPIEYLRFFFSGNKGFHILIPVNVLDIKPDKRLNEYYKAFAKEISTNTLYDVIDTRIYDKKRLFRLPNSINSKSGLYKVPITYENFLKFKYSEIKKYASKPQKISNTETKKVSTAINKYNAIIDKLIANEESNRKRIRTLAKNVDLSKISFPKCISKIFEEGVEHGMRKETAVILASALFQKGIDFDTVSSFMHKWNINKVNPPINEHELNSTIKSAYSFTQSGRRYGCSSIINLDLCPDNKNCSLRKNKK